MTVYENILAAIDFNEGCEKVLERAAMFASLNEASLHLVHVVQPIANTYSAGLAGEMMDTGELDRSILGAAQDKLAEIGSRFNVPLSNQHLVVGFEKEEIHRVAENINADLIITGSHGRHGLQLLLGSTANAVLHGAKRDVLAVRI